MPVCGRVFERILLLIPKQII